MCPRYFVSTSGIKLLLNNGYCLINVKLLLTCFPDEQDCPKDVIPVGEEVGHVTKNRLGNFHVMVISMVDVPVIVMKTNCPSS